MICAQLLTRRLRLISVCNSDGDEALRRLKMDAAHIENCLRRAQNQAQVCLPAGNNGVRILDLVRTLLAKGEKRLTKETLCREITETDAGMMLEIRELECLPDAMCIALCENFNALCKEVLEDAQLRRYAEKWIAKGGKLSVWARRKAVFFEYALQLAAEAEKPELHARIVSNIERWGEKPGRVVEIAHRNSADHSLRLENLMAAWRLLRCNPFSQGGYDPVPVDLYTLIRRE